MGNSIYKFLCGVCSDLSDAAFQPHGADASVAALGRDILEFQRTKQVPEGLGRHVVSSAAAQANCAPAHKPQGVKFELHTLPVDAKAVADGDTVTVYVDTNDAPSEIKKAAAERTKARAARNFPTADALQKTIADAGYRMVPNAKGAEVLAKKYRIRLSGIDAPESAMPYGKEAKEALLKLVEGKCLTVHVYNTDRYGRSVGDLHVGGVFVQEQMLKKGFAWHYTAYDKRPELAKWQSQAQAARKGLWAASKPQEPWEYRKAKRNGNA
ncbi:unnamed protein product [Triticum turgidum subsp. durum]|uniref:TNase-like domain-containing protein n=1 Tax=Triticum turgidum subsp. durum TaxID=4567 RepID=A0A9R1QBY7_TRITD|nr:unnamed protein product [Triticum turgidum subsp. durum]